VLRARCSTKSSCQALNMSNNYSHLLNTKTFGLFACLLFIVGSVLSESHLIKDVCHNHKWSGSQFIKDIHTCTCEPYNATDLQDKKSLIFFEVLNYEFQFMTRQH
jgi:hypothetical protein